MIYDDFKYHINDNLKFFEEVDNYYKDNWKIPRIGCGQSFGGLIIK